ncbi:hypothetical protein KIN20_020977, partial [Parelaphostrongylus tenuis]
TVSWALEGWKNLWTWDEKPRHCPCLCHKDSPSLQAILVFGRRTQSLEKDLPEKNVLTKKQKATEAGECGRNNKMTL